MKKILMLLLIVFGVLSATEQCFKLEKIPAVNNIVLVIDKSGSMKGKAMADAKKGAINFVKQLRSDDKASVITFSSDVQTIQNFTSNKENLINAINSIKPKGATALYDAVAKAFLKLHRTKGPKIIVFLTDGKDNLSNYTIKNLEQMCINTGIFVYGLGIDNIDEDALLKLTKATNGVFQAASNSNDLVSLYPKVIANYYNTYGNKYTPAATTIIKSIPAFQTVKVNDVEVGKTPLKLDNLKPGKHKLELEFRKGSIDCEFEVEAGYKTTCQLNESQIGTDVYVLSYPRESSVFIDDAFYGLTGIRGPVNTKQGWIGEAVNSSDVLKIKNIQKGWHKINIKGLADSGMDFGPALNMEFEFKIEGNEKYVVLYPDVFMKKVESNLPKEQVKTDLGSNGSKSNDPFSEFDTMEW